MEYAKNKFDIKDAIINTGYIALHQVHGVKQSVKSTFTPPPTLSAFVHIQLIPTLPSVHFMDDL